MSLESLPSRASIIDRAGVGLEHALASIAASVRAEFMREVEAVNGDRRAAFVRLEMVLEKIETVHADFRRWFELVQQQRIELRGEKGDSGPPGSPGEPGAPGLAGTAGRDGRDG